jgi:hypothetical protein
MELEVYSKSKESVCPGFVSLGQLIPLDIWNPFGIEKYVFGIPMKLFHNRSGG